MKEKISTIRTPRLLLRSISATDRAEMFQIFRDKCVKKTYMMPDLPDGAAMEKLLQMVPFPVITLPFITKERFVPLPKGSRMVRTFCSSAVAILNS